MLRGSVVQTKIQTGLCASISPKAPTSQFIRRLSSIPSPKGSTPDHVKHSASILHKRFTSLHLPTILLKLVVHFTLDSAENHIWIGSKAVILPGVRIGSRAVIGAGSIVTTDIPPRCVAAGNPARVLRQLTELD